MKYQLFFIILLLTIVKFSYSLADINISKKKITGIIKENLKKTNITMFSDREAFFPEGRIKTFSYNMVKYFSKFAKLAYCDLNIFVKNPICKKIQGEWRVKLKTQYVKVLKSAKGKIKKKVIFACSTPKRLFKLPENMLVYNETEKNNFNTTFGQFQHFKKLYEIMIKPKAEKVLIKKLFKYLLMDKLGLTQVFFVGHSWGGVLCNTLALKASNNRLFKRFKGKDSPVLITYGAPNIVGKNLPN